MRNIRAAVLLFLVSLVTNDAVGEVELAYSSVEAEAASEYQVGDRRFGPSFIRLIATAEFAITDDLTVKTVVSPCIGSYSTEQPEGVTQCSRERLVEELTLSGIGDGFDFSIGQQIITIGNSEAFMLLDRFNGRDLCRFARLDTQNKLPNLIAQGRIFSGASTFSLTFAPFSGESQLADTNGYCADRFNDFGRFEHLDAPENKSLNDWAGGLEYAVTHDNWGATLNVISTREDLFVLETLPALNKTRPRTLWIGGTASATFGGIVVRGEIAYAPERRFSLAPEAVGTLATRGIATNGVDERWNLLTLIGLETRKGDWYLALQYLNDRVTGGPDLVRDSETHTASMRVRRTFANERLAINSFAVLDMDYRDFAIRISGVYELNDDTEIEVGGTVYADFGNEPGYLGSYEGRESLYIQLRWTF